MLPLGNFWPGTTRIRQSAPASVWEFNTLPSTVAFFPATMIVQAFPVWEKRKAATRSKKKVFMCDMIFLFCDDVFLFSKLLNSYDIYCLTDSIYTWWQYIQKILLFSICKRKHDLSSTLRRDSYGKVIRYIVRFNTRNQDKNMITFGSLPCKTLLERY